MRPTNSDSASPSSSIPRHPILLCLSCATLLTGGLLGGCGGSPASFGSESDEPGQLVTHLDPGIGSKTFVVEGNHGGRASEVTIQNIYWGRLVNIFDSTGEVQNTDVVIAENILDGQLVWTSAGSVPIALGRNPVTEDWTVTIEALAGTPAFEEVLLFLDRDLTPTLNASLEPSELGPFSMVPRNAAMVIVFDDLLDPRFDDGEWVDSFGGDLVNPSTMQLNPQVVRVRTGYSPLALFETRTILDKNHGDWADFDEDGESEFHSTRVIVCTTVSEVQSAASDPPLAVNSIGLPASINSHDANLALRIPTVIEPGVGQTQLLVNPIGSVMAFGTKGWQDLESSTRDLVRALRSGGESGTTGDLHNGFLLDQVAPELIGDFPIEILEPPVEGPGTDEITIPSLRFDGTTCAPMPRAGDIVGQGEVVAEVIVPGIQGSGAFLDMRVRTIAPADGALLAGAARITTAFSEEGEELAPCFFRFSPGAASPPDQLVSPEAQVAIRFSKPMDPATITPFDTFTITRQPTDPVPYDYTVGQVVSSPDLRTFSWKHTDLPFAHEPGTAETYYINLAKGAGGPTDLAGNPLQVTPGQIPFTLDPGAGTQRNGGIVLRFHTDDEFGLISADSPNGAPDTYPELRSGHLLYDMQNERIWPRPVTRYSVAADRDKPLPSVMKPYVGGIQTPLSPLGSKLHQVWRYCDLGFSLTDETNMNVDVEGLSWAPVGGTLVSDVYEDFSVTLAHSKFLPDEFLNTAGFPLHQLSGLTKTYKENLLDPTNDPGTVVHDRSRGYIVSPANLYQATSKTIMVPYPWNQDCPVEDHTYYTWRDTALLALGGPGGNGAPLDQETLISGTTAGTYPAGFVPTIGLPLLMEFRCYPHNAALGLNAFDISLACNSSAQPHFRAFSTGGYQVGGLPVVKNPDLEDVATGGFNPGSNPPGQITPGEDCSFYIGEMALVTRVSRVHTIWFDTRSVDPTYLDPVIEPTSDEQVAGTRVILAYRGANDIAGKDTTFPFQDVRTDAGLLDFYGDPTDGTAPLYVGPDGSWKQDITEINSGRYFQARITFISNTVTNKTAELRTLGFSWRELNI